MENNKLAVLEKATIAEKYDMVANLIEDFADNLVGEDYDYAATLQNFILDRKDKVLAKSKTKSKASKKKQAEFELIEEQILQVLKPNELVQVSAVRDRLLERLQVSYSTQKLTPRLKALAKSGALQVSKEKKTTLYMLVEQK